LPTNPTLSTWMARRATAGETVLNWSATLAQEIEIGGQRGARRSAAAADRRAREELLVATRRDAAAGAWRGYFEVLAARDELELAKRLEETVQHVADAVSAAANRGLVAGIDADVADASLVRVQAARTAAEARAGEAYAVLQFVIGLEPALDLSVSGALEPLRIAEQVRPHGSTAETLDRPEIRAFEAEARADTARAEVFRRARIPSPTISAFVEQDGFAERVLGIGLAFPIPLPHPLGRVYTGDIAEAEALGRQASTRARLLRRELARSITATAKAYDGARATAALYTPERLARAEQGLSSMAAEIAAGRLGVRDAVLAQQALVEQLSAGLAARRALCLASVELARAAGVALERGVQ
jgi:outer membrane protein, heavy metal efflux system